MAKITYRKITHAAGDNETFLLPYVGEIVKLTEYKNGRIDLQLEDGSIMHQVDGNYCSEYNGWNYTIKKLLGRPLKNINWK